MEKESGSEIPESEQLSRRDFLKAAAAGSGLFAMEGRAEAQEQKVVDNHIAAYTIEADNTKINFPEKPEKITPQIEAIILAIQNYRAVHLSGNLPSKNNLDGDSLKIVDTATEETLSAAKRAVWVELKKYDPTLPEFTDEDFYKTLALKLPSYLAKYGIYARGKLSNVYNNDANGRSVNFARSEYIFSFLEIAEVKHDEIEQWGVRVQRDIVYIKGPFQTKDKKNIELDFTGMGENGFRNIVIFEQALRSKYENIISEMNKFKTDIGNHPKGEFLEMRGDQWSEAVYVVMAKILERMKAMPDYEAFEKQTLNHETRHLIDRMEGDLYRVWPLKVTAKPDEEDRRTGNFRIHDEINPSISELRYGPNKEFAFAYLISNSIETSGGTYTTKNPSQWIFRNMVEIVSEDPNRYGIEISRTMPVSVPNQIVSQLDVLFDQPKLFDEICEKLKELHTQKLSENLMEPMALAARQDSAPKPIGSKPIVKIGIPSVIIGGGVLYALKKFGERKEKVSRQQRRQESAKKEKKSKR